MVQPFSIEPFLRDRPLNRLSEVHSGLGRIDIDGHVCRSEAFGQPLAEASCIRRSGTAPVTDDDLRPALLLGARRAAATRRLGNSMNHSLPARTTPSPANVTSAGINRTALKSLLFSLSASCSQGTRDG